MNKIKLTIILMLLAALCGTAYGQVTIGSGYEPVNGALLDIKENDEPAGGVTARRGIMLPRMNLLDLTRLTGGPAGSPVIKDVADSEPDMRRHIGLTVYHLGNCPGVYVWTGTEWIKLGEPCVQAPAAPIGTDAFFCLSWTPGNEPATLTATVRTGETVDWYDNSGTKITTGITETTIGSATVSTVSTNGKTTYYAEARNTTTGAVSATRTAVFATTYNDLSVIATKATPDKTSAATNTWGTNVVHHEAKWVDANDHDKGKIYDEFASAVFGTAGRWMTTNLAAWAYDDGYTGSASLPTASSYMANDDNNPLWCYPPPFYDATGYNDDPQVGLLYNWPAATGKQNGSTAQQGQIAGTTPGNDEVEKVAPDGRYQGICPNGWHLPSDREWNQLEKYIYENAQDFSYYTADEQRDFPNDGVWDSSWDTDFARPSVSPPHAHGRAMRSVCYVDGLSYALRDGGFNAMGAAFRPGGYEWEDLSGVYYATSSSYASSDGLTVGFWGRHTYSNSEVYRKSEARRGSKYSVRCKKD